jgi:hypothetical protein
MNDLDKIIDYIIALSKDQTSNHQQIMGRLDKIEHRIETMEKNTHERSIYFQGLVQGVRSAILSKLDARSDTKPLDLSGGPR